MKKRKKLYLLAVAVFLLCGLLFFKCSENIGIYNPIAFLLHKNLRIMVTSVKGLGEYQTTLRICNTLDRMGYGSACVTAEVPMILKLFDFDFTINAREKFAVDPNSFNFLIAHVPDQTIPSGYNAVLSVLPMEFTSELFNGNAENIIPFYLTEHATEFENTPKTKLFFCGDLWDHRRLINYSKLYGLLDNTGYFEVYGNGNWKKISPKSYKGIISSARDAVLKVMKKTGVALVLHSDWHFDTNTTTARIFEATAASNVVICDRLPFIVDNFGDSVLYIDRNKPIDIIFQQIDAHMKWILSHQKEAIELARRSHEIFLKKFTLEEFLQKAIDFYLAHRNDLQQTIRIADKKQP